MSSEVLTALIATSGALVVGAMSYWFTKKRERDAELRKEKLKHYKEFVAALSGTISGESTAETQRVFAGACNKLNLVAPEHVLHALHAFQQEIKTTNSTRSNEAHDRLMSELFYEIRADLGVTPPDSRRTFKVGLWASGQPPRVEKP